MDIASIAIHLGINPVKGGSPPKDSKSIGIINWRLGDLDINLFKSILVFEENLFNKIKIGVINIEYRRKYIIVNNSLFIEAKEIIQPMWVMDE